MPCAVSGAGVAELVDALDLGSSDESRGGSSPSARTKAAGGIPDGFASATAGAVGPPDSNGETVEIFKRVKVIRPCR